MDGVGWFAYVRSLGGEQWRGRSGKIDKRKINDQVGYIRSRKGRVFSTQKCCFLLFEIFHVHVLPTILAEDAMHQDANLQHKKSLLLSPPPTIGVM